jgi:hypothetical protein
MILKLLSKKPDDRYPDAGTLLEALSTLDPILGVWSEADAKEWWMEHAPELARPERGLSTTGRLILGESRFD